MNVTNKKINKKFIKKYSHIKYQIKKIKYFLFLKI